MLNYFANGRKNKAKLWVLDKRTVKVYESSVRDVGQENFFYEYHGNGERLELEDLMQRIDSIGAKIIRKVTESVKLPSLHEEKVWLSYYIAAQILRTPFVRSSLKALRQLIVEKWGEDIRVSPHDPKTIGQYGPEDAKASSLHILNDVPRFAKFLQNKNWCLCQAPDSAAYIISDNPVTRHNLIGSGPRSNLGLCSEGIDINIPLSPKLALHLVCPTLVPSPILAPELSRAYSSALAGGPPVPFLSQNVEFMNSLQVIWAERFLYAKKAEHLEIPLDMLRTDPVLRKGPGLRQNLILNPMQ